MQFGVGAGEPHWSQFSAHRMVGALVGDGVGGWDGDEVGDGVGAGVGVKVGEDVVVASAYCVQALNSSRSIASAAVSGSPGPGTCIGNGVVSFELRKFRISSRDGCAQGNTYPNVKEGHAEV